MVRVQFAHSNQAQIREIGLSVGVPFSQRNQTGQVVVAIESHRDESIFHESQHDTRVLHVKRRLRQHRFAGQQRPGHLALEADRPVVVRVTAIHKRDQKACVSDALHPLEKPLRVDKSFGPLTQPAQRI